MRGVLACVAALCGRRSAARLSIASAAALLASSAHAASDAKPVTLYVAADAGVVGQLVAAFEAESGLRVRVVSQPASQGASGLVERLRSEKERPQADVFWNSEPFQMQAAANAGLLAPLQDDSVRDWPASSIGEGRLWHGFAQSVRVIVFNTDRVRPEDAPGSMDGLLAERFRGSIVAPTASPGATRAHLAAMSIWWGQDRLREHLRGLRSAGVRRVGSSGEAVAAVGAGEASVGVANSDDAWAAKSRGLPIGMLYVRHDVPGTTGATGGAAEKQRIGPMVIPQTVALVAGGPNPSGGRRLAVFLLSERAERMLAQSERRYVPVRPSLAAEFADLCPAEPAATNVEHVLQAMPSTARLAREELGG